MLIWTGGQKEQGPPVRSFKEDRFRYRLRSNKAPRFRKFTRSHRLMRSSIYPCRLANTRRNQQFLEPTPKPKDPETNSGFLQSGKYARFCYGKSSQ